MSNRRRRASRVLLGLLGLTIAVGLFTYVHKLNRAKASPAKGNTVAATTTTAPPIITPAAGPSTNQVAAVAPPATNPAPAHEPSAEPPAVAKGPLRTETPVAADALSQPAAGEKKHRDAVPVLALVDKPAPAASPAPTGTTAATDAATPAAASTPKASVPAYTAPTGGTAAVLAKARDLVAAGKLLEARDMVNGALASGSTFANDAAAARQLLSEINKTVVFSTRRFADDKWGGTYSVQSGDRLDRIGARYGLTPALLMKLNGISDARRLRAGATIKVLKGPFHAVVNKNAFRLDLYLGAPGGPESVYVTSFPVGLGKDDSTPEGKWLVEPQKKIKNPVYYSPRGEGVIEADDPKNPLGEYWIGLQGTEGDAKGKESYGIHGTIDPDSIGKQASMGCVRMRNEDVAVVFDALVDGKSTVLVVD